MSYCCVDEICYRFTINRARVSLSTRGDKAGNNKTLRNASATIPAVEK